MIGGVGIYITFDLGATTLKGAVFDHYGNLLDKNQCPSSHIKSENELIELISDETKVLINLVGGTVSDVKGIGIGIPGFVPEQGDIIPMITNLGIYDVNLKPGLEKLYDCCVVVENDANIAAWGEHKHGAAKDVDNMLMVTLGTGVGGGVIVNNVIMRGELGLSGEIGHIQVRPEHGRKCNCGRIGCLETESSGSAIEYYASSVFGKKTTAKDVITLAQQGNAEASKIIDSSMYYLAYAVANIIHLIEFERIVLGGGVSLGGDAVLAPIHKYLQDFMVDSSNFNSQQTVVLSELGNDAGLYGLFYLLSRPN